MNPARRRSLWTAGLIGALIAPCWWLTRAAGPEVEAARPFGPNGGTGAPLAGGGPGAGPGTETAGTNLAAMRTELTGGAHREPATHTLHGSVSTSDGKGVDSLHLRLRTAFNEYRHVELNEDRTFAIEGLQPDSYRIRAEYEGYFKLYERVDLTSDPATHALELELVAIPTITVRVGYPDGQKLASWASSMGKGRPLDVLATRAPLPTYSTPPFRRVRGLGRVDWDKPNKGTLELTEPAGAYLNLILHHSVLRTTYVPFGVDEVRFELDEATVSAACGSVRARFVRRDDEGPVTGRVSFGLAKSFEVKEGLMTATRLPAGPYELRLQPPGCAAWSRTIEVHPGLDLDLGTVAIESGPEIRGTVMGPEGHRAAIEVAPVLGHARDATWPRASSMRALRDCTFRIKGRAAGLYLVRARVSTDYRSEALLVDTRVGSREVELTLEPTTTVSIPGRAAWKHLGHIRVSRGDGLPYVRRKLRNTVTHMHLLRGKNEIVLSANRGAASVRAEIEVGEKDIVVAEDSFARAPASSHR